MAIPTARERALQLLMERGDPLCDDCIAREAGLSSRQHARSVCIELLGQGKVRRERRTCNVDGDGRPKLVTWPVGKMEPVPKFSFVGDAALRTSFSQGHDAEVQICLKYGAYKAAIVNHWQYRRGSASVRFAV